MLLGQGDYPIEAFPPECPDEPFAERVGLWALHGCFDHCKAQVLYRSVESAGEDGVAVMDDKTVRVIRGEGLTQLLEGPSGGRMSCRVEVNNAARRVFHDHQHIKQPERRRRHHAEVTGDDGRGVILEKGGPR